MSMKHFIKSLFVTPAVYSRMLEENERLKKTVAMLTEALEPFARVGSRMNGGKPGCPENHTPDDFTEVVSEMSHAADAVVRHRAKQRGIDLGETPTSGKRMVTIFAVDSLKIRHWLSAADAYGLIHSENKT